MALNKAVIKTITMKKCCISACINNNFFTVVHREIRLDLSFHCLWQYIKFTSKALRPALFPSFSQILIFELIFEAETVFSKLFFL